MNLFPQIYLSYNLEVNPQTASRLLERSNVTQSGKTQTVVSFQDVLLE